LIQQDQELALAIKLKFGTAVNSPSECQLHGIKQDVRLLVDKGIIPSNSDWFEIVKKHCPETGKYFYKGLDNSDLIILLQLATKK
jgi:hypothetical protein